MRKINKIIYFNCRQTNPITAVSSRTRIKIRNLIEDEMV